LWQMTLEQIDYVVIKWRLNANSQKLLLCNNCTPIMNSTIGDWQENRHSQWHTISAIFKTTGQIDQSHWASVLRALDTHATTFPKQSFTMYDSDMTCYYAASMSVAVYDIVASKNRNATPFTSERVLAIHNPTRYQMYPWLKRNYFWSSSALW